MEEHRSKICEILSLPISATYCKFTRFKFQSFPRTVMLPIFAESTQKEHQKRLGPCSTGTSIGGQLETQAGQKQEPGHRRNPRSMDRSQLEEMNKKKNNNMHSMIRKLEYLVLLHILQFISTLSQYRIFLTVRNRGGP